MLRLSRRMRSRWLSFESRTDKSNQQKSPRVIVGFLSESLGYLLRLVAHLGHQVILNAQGLDQFQL